MSATVYLSDPSSLEHDTGLHPERADRIIAIERELLARREVSLARRRSSTAPRAALEAVHTAGHVAGIERLWRAGGGPVDLDTVVARGSWEAALHAAGGAIDVVEVLLCGEAETAFSAHRPPGHHAQSDRAMGFCLFNNIAVAARHALDSHGLRRVLVLDWDVHHGNGTSEIFHATDSVLYVSIHQSPLYPGTGGASDTGSEAGRGYTVNLPVPGGCGDEVFCSLVEHVVGGLARSYEPELVLISAGYDAHVEDPLGGCTVTDGGYAQMAASVRRVAADLGVGLGVVLEGGYDLGALARSVAETLRVLGAPPSQLSTAVEVHPLARAGAGRLRERWPGLLRV